MKQYIIGLITGTCLVVSAVIFMGASDKNLGDIVVNSITVRTADGKEPIYISYGGEGVGYLATYNAGGERTSYIGSNKNGGGTFSTFNADGKQTSYLGTGEGGIGFLQTYNKHGVRVGYFGSDINNDGKYSPPNQDYSDDDESIHSIYCNGSSSNQCEEPITGSFMVE